MKKIVLIILSIFVLYTVATLFTDQKHIKSLDDGFRNVPWGIKKSESTQYGLVPFSDTVNRPIRESGGTEYKSLQVNEILYFKYGDNLSLGNVPLKYIFYIFPDDKLTHVDIHALPEYSKLLLEECVNLFGKPTLKTDTTANWNLSNAEIKYDANTKITNTVQVTISPLDKSKIRQKGGL